MNEQTLALANERAERAIEKYAPLLGKPGYVAQATGGEIEVVPYWQSATKGKAGTGTAIIRDPSVPVPDHIIQKARDSLPRLRRRTGAQRLKAMTDTMLEDARRSYELTGSPIIAQSMLDDICRGAALDGLGFMDPEKVRRMTLEEIKPYIEAKAKKDFSKAGHQQADSDRRKTTLDWHGDRNSEVRLAKR